MSDRPKKVLIVAPQPYYRVAGTPMNVRLMIRALGELGLEVHLVSLPHGEDVDEGRFYHHRSWALPGLGAVPIGFSGAKLVYDMVLALLVASLLVRHRFASVQAIEEAAFFACPMARLRGASAIMDLDSDLEHQLRASDKSVVRALAGLANRLRRWSLSTARCAVTVAPHLTRLVRDTAPDLKTFEIRDIPLAEATGEADPADVERLRAELDLEGRPTVVYTGNFDRRQGVQELIEAFATVANEVPGAVLLLVGGEAPEVDAMRAHAQGLGLGDRVRLTGRRPPADMPAFMALADVLVSPRLEPLVTPLKIYTYMASGRPIVATDLPTHTDVLDEMSAFLAEPTPQGLAITLGKALRDPAEAAMRADRALALVKQHYTYESFKRQLEAVYVYAGVLHGR
ncbi:MAG: glycosyltransferase family 4 protein [Geminicoccaceae bacterium]